MTSSSGTINELFKKLMKTYDHIISLSLSLSSLFLERTIFFFVERACEHKNHIHTNHRIPAVLAVTLSTYDGLALASEVRGDYSKERVKLAQTKYAHKFSSCVQQVMSPLSLSHSFPSKLIQQRFTDAKYWCGNVKCVVDVFR